MPLDDFRKRYPNLTDDQIADMADIALMAQGNPKTRKKFLQTVKEANPNMPIPEIDEPARVEGIIAEERKQRENFEAEQRNRWLSQDLERERSDVASQFSLSADDMKAMEKMMTEKTLPADYKWAAPLYKQQVEQSTPTTNSGMSYLNLQSQLASNESLKGLMEDENSWARQQADAMINDFQRSRGRAA